MTGRATAPHKGMMIQRTGARCNSRTIASRCHPPDNSVKTKNRDGYVDRVTRQDSFNPPPVQGKPSDNDMLREVPFRKPYMYIDRESCQTDKQRLEARCELSTLEYTNALVKLIMDHRAYHPNDQSHILRRLRDVTHDAMERPWSAVRRWSQVIFYLIVRGDFAWYEHQEIQKYGNDWYMQSSRRAKPVSDAKGALV